ncbi:hypothetical protein HPB49_006904 [Dermacentor silvarum]|uniref:Uncharacterized protein n=1 Tax=Dermacentor silvarum TaxID=543639 RepID=A0ACB8C2G4_DERSI|nr:hypothetical protein HPB49_006904 [Dermacentor silvarum]
MDKPGSYRPSDKSDADSGRSSTSNEPLIDVTSKASSRECPLTERDTASWLNNISTRFEAIESANAHKKLHTLNYKLRGFRAKARKPLEEHLLEAADIDGILLELLHGTRKTTSLYILNLYSPPKSHLAPLIEAMRKALIPSSGTRLLVHPTQHQPRPHALEHIREGRWTNTIHSLSSNHYILCTEFSISFLAPPKRRVVRVVDWDKFRHFRQTAPDTIAELDAWATSLTQDVEQATSTIPEPEDVAAADSCLLQMWEAHASLQKCWLAQKHNRSLKRRIARLVAEIKAHASNLAHQQWGQVCDGKSGNLGLKDTWSFLRFLFDPGHKKATQGKNFTPILHQIPLEDDALLQALKE